MIRRIGWTSQLQRRVEAVESDPADVAAMRDDVESGRAAAWTVNDGSASLITRVESVGGRVEFVVAFAGGRDLAPLIAAIYAEAQSAGAARVRWHTRRPGLRRIVERQYPVVEIERVYAVEVAT